MNRIAVIEDHERMAALICRAFANTGIEVEVYDRVATARRAISQLSYSALVLDRGLPDGDGLELIRELRARGEYRRDALRGDDDRPPGRTRPTQQPMAEGQQVRE